MRVFESSSRSAVADEGGEMPPLMQREQKHKQKNNLFPFCIVLPFFFERIKKRGKQKQTKHTRESSTDHCNSLEFDSFPFSRSVPVSNPALDPEIGSVPPRALHPTPHARPSLHRSSIRKWSESSWQSTPKRLPNRTINRPPFARSRARPPLPARSPARPGSDTAACVPPPLPFQIRRRLFGVWRADLT